MEDWQDYYDYLCRYSERSGGLPSDVNSRMTEYANDSSKLTNDLVDGHAEVILLFPQSPSRGSDNSIGLLHQCVISEQLTDVTGIPDLLRFTPPKTVALGSLVRPFSIPPDRQDDLIPTASQLGKASSFEEFIDLRGRGGNQARELASLPAFVRIHPAGAARFLPLEGDLNPESIFDEMLSTMRDFSKKEREAASQGQGALLLFLWATGNGFVGTKPRVKAPSYSDLATVSERAMTRFQSLREESAAAATSGSKVEPDSEEEKEKVVEGGGEEIQEGSKEKGLVSYEEGKGQDDHEEATYEDKSGKEGSGKEREARKRRRSRSESAKRESRRKTNRRRKSRSRNRSRDRRRKRNRRRSRSSSSESSHSRRRSRGGARSCSSESSSSDSSEDSRHRHRRDRSRSGRRESNRQRGSSRTQAKAPIPSSGGDQQAAGPDLSDLLKEMRGYLASTRDYQRASTLRLDQERMERSTLGQYAARQKFLARYLAARDYRDKNPTMSSTLQDLLSTKNPLTQWQMIQDMVSDAKPPGIISQSGVTHFLSRGFLDANQPGGFTLFMFSPFRKLSRRLSQRKKDIKLAYGEIGKLSEEDVEELAKNGYHLPTSMSEAKDMLKVGVWFLEELTCSRGIASEGYREGLRLVQDYGDRFREATEKDPGFPAKFLGYLDALFQHFCQELKDFAHRSSPIRRARKSLRGFMVQEVKDTFKNFKIYGIVPQLNHPVLDDEDEKPKQPQGDKGAAGTEPAPEWHSKNPSPEAAWSTPSGKKHGDFFNTSSQLGKDNVARLPRCRHHRTGKMQTICAKYQASGKCIAGCRQSHVKVADMSDELKQNTHDAFAKAYKAT